MPCPSGSRLLSQHPASYATGLGGPAGAGKSCHCRSPEKGPAFLGELVGCWPGGSGVPLQPCPRARLCVSPGATPRALSLQEGLQGCAGTSMDNALNDFTTRSQSVVGDGWSLATAGNSLPGRARTLWPPGPWHRQPVPQVLGPEQCSIINSAPSSACRSQVGRVGWDLRLA